MTGWDSAKVAVRAVREQLSALPPLEAARAADQWRAFLSKESDAAANVRAVAVARLRASERLSHAEVAAILGVSRGRVAQMVRGASPVADESRL
ncbi:MAG: hypothetical protein ACRCYU_16085 [Nocardioides sp.]